jgi:acyl-homoserine lactone acylase PvdQ
MTVRTEFIRVKEGDRVLERRFEIEYTHHGPVVARKDGKAYAIPNSRKPARRSSSARAS